MSSKCSVANCSFQSAFTFHSPRSRPLLALWKKILNIKIDEFFVCDQHFEEKFVRTEKRLTADAFPTQFISDVQPGGSDFCQCCLKSFVRTKFLTQSELKLPIGGMFKKEYKEVMGIEITNGVICAKCYDSIKTFDKFRQQIHEKQSKREEILKNCAEIIKKESDNVLFDPNIKIKEEPMDVNELESVIEIQEESFSDVKIKEEVIEENVVIKEESNSESTFVISEVKTEPEEFQTPKPYVISKVTPTQKFILKPPNGIVVRPVNMKNLKIIQPAPMQKFKIIRQAAPPQSSTFKTIVQSPRVSIPSGVVRIVKNSQPIASTNSTAGFKCQYCPNRFVERRFVFEHIKQKHVFSCNMCASVFPFKITLIKHQMTVHGHPMGSAMPALKTPLYRYACTVCACRFSSPTTLDVHMKMKHSSVIKQEKVVKVERVVMPPTQPTTSKAAMAQMNLNALKQKPMMTLVKKILEPANFTPPEPEIVEEDPDGIPCLDCGLLLKPDKLLKHRMDVHSFNTHNMIYSCDLCGTEIRGKTQLINHMTTKHLSKYYVRCEFCDGLFENQTEAICHKNLQHNMNGTRYTCHFCNKIFGSKRDMILHRKQHYSEKESREKLARIFCKKFKSYEPKGEEYKN